MMTNKTIRQSLRGRLRRTWQSITGLLPASFLTRRRKDGIVAFQIFSLCILAACSSSSLSGTDDVGTVLTRPKPPSLTFFPDFQSFISEDTLTDDGTALMKGNVKSAITNLNVLFVWEDVVISGSFAESRSERDIMEQFGQLAAQAITDNDITEAPDDEVQVTIDEESELVDTTSASGWTVGLKAEGDLVRFYFTNNDTGLIQATYLVEADDDGNAVRGIFAFVNPDMLELNPGDDRRMYALAFDFSDPEQALLTVRTEVFSTITHNYHAQQMHEQCNSNGECLGEFVQVITEAPERTLDETGFRFSWNENTSEVCLADVEYDSGALETLQTFSFAGPEGPQDGSVELDVCTVDNPVWGDHVFTEADLLNRFEDTDPVGGTSLALYVDGVSQSGWDTLTESLISSWNDASAF